MLVGMSDLECAGLVRGVVRRGALDQADLVEDGGPAVPRQTDKRFADWLREELRRREWSQSDFARRADVYDSVVSKWLSGTRPSVELVDRVADVLGADLVPLLVMTGYLPEGVLGQPEADPERARLLAKLRRVQLTGERALLLDGLLDVMLRADRNGRESGAKEVGTGSHPRDGAQQLSWTTETTEDASAVKGQGIE
jgi:transcriptional regulator with XRE-family HTH domain